MIDLVIDSGLNGSSDGTTIAVTTTLPMKTDPGTSGPIIVFQTMPVPTETCPAGSLVRAGSRQGPRQGTMTTPQSVR